MEQPVDMDVALPAFARRKIVFEIGVGASRCADVIERSRSERRAPKIRVQDHAGGVDERQQRVTERVPELAFDRRRQAGKRQVERFVVQCNAQFNPADLTVGNFLSQPRHHNPDAFRNGGMSVAPNQLLHAGLPEKFVD